MKRAFKWLCPLDWSDDMLLVYLELTDTFILLDKTIFISQPRVYNISGLEKQTSGEIEKWSKDKCQLWHHWPRRGWNTAYSSRWSLLVN